MRKSSEKKELVKKMPKPNNVITVPTSLDSFFKWWCIFLRPFIKLTDREIDIVSCFLKQRWHLSKSISDQTILDKMLLSEDVKSKVQEECKITPQHLYVVVNKLKKNKVIINNTLNPRLIPNIRTTDNGCFQLLVLFKDTEK
jgi:hypothetical protein